MPNRVRVENEAPLVALAHLAAGKAVHDLAVRRVGKTGDRALDVEPARVLVVLPDRGRIALELEVIGVRARLGLAAEAAGELSHENVPSALTRRREQHDDRRHDDPASHRHDVGIGGIAPDEPSGG